MKKRFWIYFLRAPMAAALACILFFALPAMAQKDTSTAGTESGALGKQFQDQPLPPEAKNSRPKPPPERFDGGGRIDIIYQDSVVINDKEKMLASGVTYHNDSGHRIETTRFEVGTVVRYKVNGRGEIREIWLDRKPEPGEE